MRGAGGTAYPYGTGAYLLSRSGPAAALPRQTPAQIGFSYIFDGFEALPMTGQSTARLPARDVVLALMRQLIAAPVLHLPVCDPILSSAQHNFVYKSRHGGGSGRIQRRTRGASSRGGTRWLEHALPAPHQLLKLVDRSVLYHVLCERCHVGCTFSWASLRTAVSRNARVPGGPSTRGATLTRPVCVQSSY